MVQLIWKTMVLFKKLKRIKPYKRTILFLSIYSRVEGGISQRDFYTHIHTNISHNNRKVEASKVSINE